MRENCDHILFTCTGSLQLSQVPVIVSYLGEKFGLCPETEEDRYHAEQISHSCYDYISEGQSWIYFL